MDNFRLDPKGYFLIKFTDGKVHVGHFSNDKKLIKEYLSDSAQQIYKEIISDDAVTFLEHAAYLGSEIYKAEVALKLGLKYVQDDPLDFSR